VQEQDWAPALRQRGCPVAASNFLRRLLSWLLHGGSSSLRDYEVQIITDVFSGSAAYSLVQGQLGQLSRVQRFNSDRQVNLFFSGDVQPLPNKQIELTVGRLRYRCHGGSVTAVIVADRGVLSSIEFSRAPQKADLAGGLLEERVLPNDPMETSRRPTRMKCAPSELQRLLGQELAFEDVLEPAGLSDIERFENEVGTRPRGFAEIARLADGWRCGGWHFYGTHPRRLPRRGDTLIAVAEKGDRAVCVATANNGWCVLDGVDDDFQTMAGDLGEVLREELNARQA
jgi:hypothetical protein